MLDESFESIILRIEQAWHRNDPPVIGDFLARFDPIGSQDRRTLLAELICVDLEFRWRLGSRDLATSERLLLDDYALRFPELGGLDHFPLEIIGEEYRVRHVWGDRPDHPEFLSRFHARQDEIRSELIRIDRELEEELADQSRSTRAKVNVSSSGRLAEIVEGPLLSHKSFRLQRMIGSGRMGKVYKAWQHDADRLVAVKFLRKSFLHQARIVRRFIGEARIIAGMRHPNIVEIHGFGCTPGGSYFIVMDLVEGPNLAVVRRMRSVSMEEAARWAIELCNALEHSHAGGIVHCDLKPANLVLGGDGILRVTDFGLARTLAGQTEPMSEIEGTAPFMAPEQVSRCWGRIDTRTDIYGLGSVLFTLLTGRPPWMGPRLSDILADITSAMPVIAPATLRADLPKALGDICSRCLSKAPEDRYQRVQEVRMALTEFIDGLGLRESSPGRLGR